MPPKKVAEKPKAKSSPTRKLVKTTSFGEGKKMGSLNSVSDAMRYGRFPAQLLRYVVRWMRRLWS
jgi:hypothetical protein